MMRLFLKRIGFVLLAFISLSMLISYASLWSLRQSSFYKPSFLVNSVADKDFDYIVLGASTGLTTLNTAVIDSVLQTNGINLSMDDTSLSSQYLMLQHFLAEGKTTKYCILAPSAASFDANPQDISDNDYRFLPFIHRDYVSDYFKSYTGSAASIISNSSWFPVQGVSYYNAEVFYPSLLAVFAPKKRNRFDARGNYTYPSQHNIDKPINEFKTMSISFKNNYVRKIKALCDQNNITLICYFSPIAGKKVEVALADFNIINHSDVLKNSLYFYDAIHVNSKGRQQASEQFTNDFKAFQQ